MKEHMIVKVQPGSIAEELELEPGDVLLAVNGHGIEDVFDYHYYTNEEFVAVAIRKADGEEWLLEVEKEYEEDLGIEFENGLMDGYKPCQNKCIFCFIDQMPKGMRETLYFKDDDSRLSFLQGNYVTLTNMKEHDIARVIEYKLGPINISVHATDPGLRCKMLNNRFAGDALKMIDRLYEAGVPMNGQIVLCKGVNDGQALEKSITDLMAYLPVMESVSVVPVGLSRYREGLYPLEPFSKEDAGEVLERIHHYQDVAFQKAGVHFVHASDEWYLLAGQELPEEGRYDGYPQLENGVGMLRLLRDEFAQAMEGAAASQAGSRPGTATIATGELAAPTLKELARAFQDVFPEKEIQVVPVANDFFGRQITVSGLLTGRDLIAQLRGRELGERLLLPCSLLRSGEEVLLDDVTLPQLESALQVRIDIVKSSGQDLVKCLMR